MKTVQTITTEDIAQLKGQFIVQLDHCDMKDNPIDESNIEFYSVKRISLVAEVANQDGGATYGMINMFSNGKSTFRTPEAFVEKFNAVGEDRYYRLLKPEELTLFNDFMLKQRRA